VRFAIYGTGAVGAYLGARLTVGGHSVRYLARPAWVGALRRRGVRLVEGTRAVDTPAPEAFVDASQALRDIDVVLLTVKAYDAASAADDLAKRLAPSVSVVSLLNGIGSEATLGRALGPERIIAASLTTAVQTIEPGIVRIERERGLGLAAGLAMSRPLAEAFQAGGVRTRLYRVPDALKWSKLMTNMVANASSAILGWTAAAVMGHPGIFHLEVEALREALRVMRALGLSPIALPGVRVDVLGRLLFLPSPWLRPVLGGIVSRGRGSKLPSFHRDIGRGRSEVYWLNGAVVAHGERAGVATPANRVLTDAFDGLVRSVTPPEEFFDRPERLIEAAALAGVPGAARYNRPR
jgi:2-dehydropantoate 2-reductase